MDRLQVWPASQAESSAARSQRKYSRLPEVTGTRNDGAGLGLPVEHLEPGAAAISKSGFINFVLSVTGVI